MFFSLQVVRLPSLSISTNSYSVYDSDISLFLIVLEIFKDLKHDLDLLTIYIAEDRV